LLPAVHPKRSKPNTYVRVVSFTDVTVERVEQLAVRIEEWAGRSPAYQRPPVCRWVIDGWVVRQAPPASSSSAEPTSIA
jgi:hypothetical protein